MTPYHFHALFHFRDKTILSLVLSFGNVGRLVSLVAWLTGRLFDCLLQNIECSVIFPRICDLMLHMI